MKILLKILLPVIICFTSLHAQNSYDITSLDINKIEGIEISEDGKGLIFKYTDSSGDAYVRFNGVNYGPLKNFSFFKRQNKMLSEDGAHFYVSYVSMTDEQTFITDAKQGTFKQEVSTEGFFNESGKAAFAFIESSQLYIQKWDEVIGPIDSTNYLGNFRIYKDGTAGVSYLQNTQDHIYFNGEVIGPLENVSVNSIQFPAGSKTYAYRQGTENGENYYIIGDQKFGPYQIGSDHITFSDNGNVWGFIYEKNNEVFVKTKSANFGPYTDSDYKTDLEIFNNDPNDFAFFYLVEKDSAIYLQRRNNEPKQITVPSFQISQPIFSSDGKVFEFVIRSPEGHYVKINEKNYGPFESAQFSLYNKSIDSRLNDFTFQKHNAQFLSLDDKYFGPYFSVDYEVTANEVNIGFIDAEKITAGVRTIRIRDIENKKSLNPDNNFNYSASLMDKTVSFDIPFNWNSYNIYEATRFFPGILLYKNNFNVTAFVETLLDNGKINLNNNKAIIISVQGSYEKNTNLLKLAKEQVAQLKGVSINKKPQIVNINKKSMAYAALSTNNYIYIKLGWFFIDNELIYIAVYQSDKPKKLFDETDWDIISSIHIEDQ